MRPQRGQFVQLAILRDMGGKRGGVRAHGDLQVINCLVVLRLNSVFAEQATRATRTAPVAPGWSPADTWLRPDVIAIAASAAVRARTHILASACADQAHSLERQIE